MIRYALQTLGARKAAFVGAFVSLFCAATLVSACGILLQTGLMGNIGTERYYAAPVVVAGDQNVHLQSVEHKNGTTRVKNKAKSLSERVWLPTSTVATLAALSDVGTVIPETTFPAYAVTPHGQIVPGVSGKPSYGHAWDSAAFTPFRVTSGAPPMGPDDVVVDHELAGRLGLRPGAELTVQSTASPKTYGVTGIASAQGGDLHEQTSLFFSSAEAQRLSGHPAQVDAIGVWPKVGVSTADLAHQVSEALSATSLGVHTGGGRGPVEFLDASKAKVKLVSIGGAIGGTSLLVALLVIIGTFALSIQQRHREIALLRAIAATPKQIRRLIGREALLIGVVAGVLGSIAGLPIAYWLRDRLVSFHAIPDTLQLSVGPFPFFVAAGAALLGGWTSARISGRRVARIHPAEALSEAAVQPPHLGWGRLLAGVGLLVGGTSLLLVLSSLHSQAASTPVTYLIVVVLSMASALGGPIIVRIATLLLGILLRASRVSGHLATANTSANARRLSSAVIPLALLIGTTCTVLFVQTTMGGAATAQAKAGTKADWLVTSTGPGVPAAAAAQLADVPGVTAVTETSHTVIRVGLQNFQAQGVSPAGLTRTWDPQVTHGSLSGFGDRSVALSQTAADGLHLEPGSILSFTFGDGTKQRLTVVALYSRGLGFGDMTMGFDLVSHHVDNPLASSVLVATAGNRPTGRSQLATAVRGFPGLRVLDRSQMASLQTTVQQSDADVNYLAMGLVIAFTALAAVNALAMSVSDRSREFALLRLVGTTRHQVMSMLLIESALVLLTAAVLGSGISLAVLTAFSAGEAGGSGLSVAPWTYLGVLGLAGLLTALATLIPGRVALTRRPADVIASAR